MVVVKLHASLCGILGRANTERRHASAVHIQGAIGKEVEEEAVVHLFRVRDMLREIVMVENSICSGRVVHRE